MALVLTVGTNKKQQQLTEMDNVWFRSPSAAPPLPPQRSSRFHLPKRRGGEREDSEVKSGF